MKNIYFDISKLKGLGRNSIIGKSVRIRHPERVTIGDNCIIDDFTYISTGLELGKCCHISSNVTISGGAGDVKMGAYSTISANCSIHAGSSDYREVSLDLPSVPKEVRFGGYVENINIGDFVVIGAHSTILPGVTLPDGFAAGAYTLISQKIYKEWTLYIGHSCTPLSKRDPKKILQMIKENKL